MPLASDILQKVILGAKDVGAGMVQGVGTASEYVRKNPITSAATVAGGVLAGVTAIQIVRKAKSKSAKAKAKRKKTTKRKGGSRDRKFISKQKHEQAYIRRKRKAGKKITRPRYKTKTSGRKTKKRVGKIYYTKKGQPYKIMASGKARFIKKGGRKK